MIRQAIANLTAAGGSRKSLYNGITYNCQDWAEDLRQEYQLLLQEEQSETSVIVKTVDPNRKTGPAGFGTYGLITASGTLAYRVDFENEPTATAPTQIVTVTDQLDADLDWATFDLTEVGFGDTHIAVPANSQHFETSVPMSYNGVSFEVQIEAGIYLTTGEVYANSYSIDPLTGLPPTVDIGFLPPEDGTGRGQGYFSYVIKPKPGLTTGTEIRNVAQISFDFQQTIATNQVDPHDPSKGTDPSKECLNTISAGSLDVDGSGLPPDVATDIVYIARYLLGLACVPPSFRALDPSIPSDGDIAANVNVIGQGLDVDANGVVDVATDIVYIARRLLGLPPVPPSFRVIDPSIPSDADIAARIDALCP